MIFSGTAADLHAAEKYLEDRVGRIVIGCIVLDAEDVGDEDGFVPLFVIERAESLRPTVKKIAATFDHLAFSVEEEDDDPWEVLDCWVSRSLEAETGECQVYQAAAE